MMLLSDAADGGGFAAYNSNDADDSYYPIAQNGGDDLYQQAPPVQQLQQQQASQYTAQTVSYSPQVPQQQSKAPIAIIPTQRGMASPPPLPAPMPMLAAAYPASGYYQQQHQQQQQYVTLPMPPTEPGYFETLWARRRAVVKLVVLALVVLLAVSSHATIWHYLKQLIEDVEPTRYQEIALRVAYPLAVLAVMWNLKAFVAI
jgi:hypothetical protein